MGQWNINMAKVEVEVTFDNYKKVMKGLDFLEKSGVYVGIPESETSRPDDKTVTNAELLFIHTNGSPVNNVPARPVIEPALEKDSDRLSKMMEKVVLSALENDFEKAEKNLKLTGMRGQNVSRAWFTDPENKWPPNSPSVERAKRKKGSTNPRPLIDTGELRKSITYVVEVGGVKK